MGAVHLARSTMSMTSLWQSVLRTRRGRVTRVSLYLLHLATQTRNSIPSAQTTQVAELSPFWKFGQPPSPPCAPCASQCLSIESVARSPLHGRRIMLYELRLHARACGREAASCIVRALFSNWINPGLIYDRLWDR